MKTIEDLKKDGWTAGINQIVLGDCLEGMKLIPDKSIDAIICDLPYGTTACSWDIVIPFKELWVQYKRITKINSPIILFGAQPFTSKLVMSNINNFKYSWIWEKDKATGHLNSKKQPMKNVEDICVFYGKQCTYNPQMYVKKLKDIRPPTNQRSNSEVYGNMTTFSKREQPNELGYPKQILKFSSQFGGGIPSFHPTQKPLELLKYLILTYSNKSSLILDNCMGSWTTARACKDLNRDFIGFELEQKYCEIGEKRLQQQNLF